jgi:C1A family cysteine protease
MRRSIPGNKKASASRRVAEKVRKKQSKKPSKKQSKKPSKKQSKKPRKKQSKEPSKKHMLAAPNWFDLRSVGNPPNNYITAVQDQDAYGPCNSCTAFAVVAAVEGSYNFQKNMPIQPNATTPGFSEAELFFCANVLGACGCTAWYPEDALPICISQGLTDRGNNNGSTQVCVRPGANWSWTKLQATQQLANATEMKKWISGNSPAGPGGPVISVMIEYDDLRYSNNGPTNPYTPSPDTWASPNTRVGGHVVCIVGYDDRPATPYWICKNSWGTTWNPNEGGYLYIAQENPGHPQTYIDSFDMWGVVLP